MSTNQGTILRFKRHTIPFVSDGVCFSFYDGNIGRGHWTVIWVGSVFEAGSFNSGRLKKEWQKKRKLTYRVGELADVNLLM